MFSRGFRNSHRFIPNSEGASFRLEYQYLRRISWIESFFSFFSLIWSMRSSTIIVFHKVMEEWSWAIRMKHFYCYNRARKKSWQKYLQSMINGKYTVNTRWIQALFHTSLPSLRSIMCCNCFRTIFSIVSSVLNGPKSPS